MGRIQRIGAPQAQRVTEVLEELLVQAQRGELIALAFLAESTKAREPLSGMVGRYRDDPSRVLGELAIMKARIAQFAANQRGDFGHSVK